MRKVEVGIERRTAPGSPGFDTAVFTRRDIDEIGCLAIPKQQRDIRLKRRLITFDREVVMCLALHHIGRQLALRQQGIGGDVLTQNVDGIEQGRIDPDQYITNDGFAGNDVSAFLAPAAKALAGLGAQVVCPSSDGLVATHPAQGGSGGYAEHHGEAMTQAFGATRIGDVVKEIRQGTHLCRGEHDLGHSGELKVCSVGVSQLRLRVTTQRTNKDPLGGVDVRAVAITGSPIALGESQLNPVGGAIDAAFQRRRRQARLRDPLFVPSRDVPHRLAYLR